MMPKFSTQNSFEFTHNQGEQFPAEDFICAATNMDAFKIINKWPEFWPNNSLIISGPSYCGKTHLAKIWQKKSSAVLLNKNSIEKESLQNLLSYITDNNVIIEDIEKLEDSDSQEKIFHIFNKVISSNNFILITMSKPVLAVEFHFNDLKSRLVSSYTVNISEPDEDMMRIIISKKFSDKQVNVSADVIDFLIPRIERNFESVKNTVEIIDRKSIEMKKSITIPFVKQVLSI